MYENEIEHTVTIAIDGTKIHSYIQSINMNFLEGNYVNEVSIEFETNAWALWNTLCNPFVNSGIERIVITVNGYQYKFLLERRSSRVTEKGKTFSIWGRSKAALLDMPYAIPISDTDDYTNPWQQNNMYASVLIEYLVTGSGVSVDFRIDDFTIYANTFSVENETPIQIIDKLAKVPGGRVRSGLDGNLIIDYREYSVLFSSDSTNEYTDIDDIVQVDEDVQEPPGYNKVRITGYQDLAASSGKSIRMELEQSSSCINVGVPFNVRVITTPFNMAYEFDTTIGTFYHVGEYEETHSETIYFHEGIGNTEYPILSVTSWNWHGDDLGAISWTVGYDGLVSDTKGFGVIEITYTTQYTLYEVIINDAGGAIIFAEEIVS